MWTVLNGSKGSIKDVLRKSFNSVTCEVINLIFFWWFNFLLVWITFLYYETSHHPWQNFRPILPRPIEDLLSPVSITYIICPSSMQICQARAWILSTGFTLAFGAMFSKVWRVHRFTTKAKTDPKVRTVLSDCYHDVHVTMLNNWMPISS